ncbi:MAG: serine protease [Alphaproteobacteria bacterium]|nr:serine protease [Alphaproteobacteria bacterium]
MSARILSTILIIVFVLGLVDRPRAAEPNPLRAVVGIQASIPSDARTAGSLGTERRGGGVLIDGAGLVLTIGYLILEAESVAVEDAAGRRIPAEIVAYDHETGFGLVRALGPVDGQPVRLGAFGSISPGHALLAAGPGFARPTVLIDRRPFAGGWEYLLEAALYTSPPIPNFGGAALFDTEGQLVGIGSLLIGDVSGDGAGIPGNLFVPIDLLAPILGDLLAFGRSTTPAHPWIGLYPNEVDGALVVGRVSPGGPAAAAGIRVGDIILGVADEPVRAMEVLWRRLRALGHAGVDIPLKVMSDGIVRDVTVMSRDRHDWLKLRRSY